MQDEKELWRERLREQHRRDNRDGWVCRFLQASIVALVIGFVWLYIQSIAQGSDWVTESSFYTHRDGVRVDQYTPIGPFFYGGSRDQGGWSRSVIRGPDGSVDVYWSGTYRGVVSPYLDFGNTSRIRMPWDQPGPVNNPWEYNYNQRRPRRTTN